MGPLRGVSDSRGKGRMSQNPQRLRSTESCGGEAAQRVEPEYRNTAVRLGYTALW